MRLRPTNPYAAGIVALTAGLATVLVALALVTPRAAAASIFEDRSYRVDVTGIQVVDWRARSSWPLDDLAGWTRQDGSQTLGWRTTRTGTIVGTRYRVRRLGGTTLPAFTIGSAGRRLRMRGTVLRSSRITRKAADPVCEGGSLDPECRTSPAPLPVPQSCGRRTLAVQTTVAPSGSENEDLIVLVHARPDERYPQCGPVGGVMGLRPPTVGTGRSPEGDLDVTFRDAAPRIGRLGRGRTLRLHREVRLGCPLPAVRPGHVDACTTTDLTVELTRTR